MYVPQGWAYTVQPGGDKSVTIAEAKLTSEGVEEAALALGEQELHALKKALEEPYWHLWRRFTQILHQRKKTK